MKQRHTEAFVEGLMLYLETYNSLDSLNESSESSGNIRPSP